MKVLVVNGGSSSFKCGFYDLGDGPLPPEAPEPQWQAHVEWSGDAAEVRIQNAPPDKRPAGSLVEPLAGVLGIEDRPLVSADYANDSRSSIVDGPSTLVTDGTMLKVYAWYDNEIGYACRMVDLANIVIDRSA